MHFILFLAQTLQIVKMTTISAVGLLSLLAAPAAAFWRLPCKSPIVVERADPIVNPGKQAGHTHQIMGGNGFNLDMTYADTQASTCTSCTVHGDFSNYWTPNLYYQHEDGSFEAVKQVGGGTIYYLQRQGPNKDKLQAFPEGFRMLAGDPFKRSPGDDFASQAISYNCLNYKGPAKPETGGFPDYNCPDGLRAQVFFPSCWDGVNNDSPDHKSHMAYPIGAYNNGKCPDTHPVHLISLFYEIIFDTNKFADQWHNGKQPFVWAMGDPTGYGFHGDFLMGWDRPLLQKAIDECTNDSGRVEDCGAFQLYPDATASACKIKSHFAEDVFGPFKQLPGCNPVQQGPGQAQVMTNCEGSAQTPINGGTGSSSGAGNQATTSASKIGSGSGSGQATSSSASIASASSVIQQTNVQSTTKAAVTTPAAAGNPSNSNTPKPNPSVPHNGDGDDNDGPNEGSGTSTSSSSSQSAPSSSATNPTSGIESDWTFAGCYIDTVRPRSLPKLAPYTLVDKLVTSTACVTWCKAKGYVVAGTEYGGECWCGSAQDASTVVKADDEKCSMACKGDNSQLCGGSAALSLYKAAEASIIPSTNGTSPTPQQYATWAKRDANGDIIELTRSHMKRHFKGRHQHSL